MPETMLGLPIDFKTVSKVFSIFFNERVRSSCFLGLYFECWMVQETWKGNVLGGPFASVGLLKYTLVIPSHATFARRTMLGSDTFHF